MEENYTQEISKAEKSIKKTSNILYIVSKILKVFFIITIVILLIGMIFMKIIYNSETVRKRLPRAIEQIENMKDYNLKITDAKGKEIFNLVSEKNDNYLENTKEEREQIILENFKKFEKFTQSIFVYGIIYFLCYTVLVTYCIRIFKNMKNNNIFTKDNYIMLKHLGTNILLFEAIRILIDVLMIVEMEIRVYMFNISFANIVIAIGLYLLANIFKIQYMKNTISVISKQNTHIENMDKKESEETKKEIE